MFQYAEEGGKKLKYLYDEFPEKKMLVTGSSASEMTVKGLKYLTGRVLKFRLFPFTFREYLRTKDKELYQLFIKREEKLEGWIKGDEEIDITEASLERMENLRKKYAVYGGYPRVVLSDSGEEKQKVLENIVETYLVREIGDVMGIEDDREIEDLMKLLGLQMGEKTNYNPITEDLGISYQKLKDRLSILEHRFVLEQVRPFYTDKKKEIVKSPKIYFHDPGFRNSLLNSFQQLEYRNDKGELNENFFFTQARKELKYWRTKSRAEVDFVRKNGDIRAYEIKSKPKMTKSVRSFQEKYEPEEMFIMNEEKIEKKDSEIYLPLIFSERAVNLE